MHIGFIMDGNGRWALRKGLTRIQGHEHGIQTANEIMKACVKRRIERATFYAFSVQNWSRDRTEIESIYTAGKALFEAMRDWVKDNNVVVKCVGSKFNQSDPDKEENPKVRAALELAKVLMAETATNTGTIITLCVSYGGREEILDVFRSIQQPLTTLTTTMISDFFQIPDVDLVVRTSGEYRISNFLLWQSAYAEYYFTEKMWPEFTEADLDRAVESFGRRNRRFGTIQATKTPLTAPEELIEYYEELFESFGSETTATATTVDLRILYTTLTQSHTFPSTPSKTRHMYQEATLASRGSTTILLELHDLSKSDRAAAYRCLAKAFTIETLDIVFKKPMRLQYIDTTADEKHLLQTICSLESDSTFLHRIASAYYGLKLHVNHMLHEDVITLCAPLLLVCGDILDRRFDYSYFDQETLKPMLFQLVQELLQLESKSPKEVRDLLAFACLSVLFHYFEEPNPSLPASSLDFMAYLQSQLKELAADRFVKEKSREE